MSGRSKRMMHKTSAVYIAMGVVLITLMTLIGASVFLQVVEIDVDGALLYTNEDIVNASGLSFGDNLMFVSTRTVSQNLRQALPFIKDTHITKVLPNKILIEVTESEARSAFR